MRLARGGHDAARIPPQEHGRGRIYYWLKMKHEKEDTKPTLAEYASRYRMRGEKIVACHMLSRRNDNKYFGQWLVLNVRFRDVRAVVVLRRVLPLPVLELQPDESRHLGEQAISTRALEELARMAFGCAQVPSRRGRERSARATGRSTCHCGA